MTTSSDVLSREPANRIVRIGLLDHWSGSALESRHQCLRRRIVGVSSECAGHRTRRAGLVNVRSRGILPGSTPGSCARDSYSGRRPHLRRRVFLGCQQLCGDHWHDWSGNDRLCARPLLFGFQALQARPEMATPIARTSCCWRGYLDVDRQCTRRSARCRTRERTAPYEVTHRYSNRRAVFGTDECFTDWRVRSLVASAAG
jgi:hypothetical protein